MENVAGPESPTGENRLILGPMLRHVGETTATVWVETSQPGELCVLGTRTPTFTVEGHHYGLVIVTDLQPGTITPYEVELDGRVVWPDPASELPPSVIRTLGPPGPVTVLLGSCRAAAPHEPPYDLERVFDHEGRGIDALWAHARRCRHLGPERWPDLALFVGDQVYADDTSPLAKERIRQCRPEGDELPPEIVATFEEYTWLYHESWSPPVERWFLSVVPSAMIIDDHDMIDDWNISESWQRDIRTEPWWREHVLSGLMSYWVYQHLGNLAPEEIEADGLLAELVAAGDGSAELRRWAARLVDPDPAPGPDGPARVRRDFGYSRQIRDVTLVAIDARNDRQLRPRAREMIGDDQWARIRDLSRSADGHLLLATSLPVFVADGLHDLQVWNERVCDGAWGRRLARWGERVRRSLDLEDWSAFVRSYRRFEALLSELRRAEKDLSSIVVASGDIHFSYAARVPLEGTGPGVWQVVSSPIRNALIPHERGVIRLSLGRGGRLVGDLLRRSARCPRSRPGIELVAGPYFANNICVLQYDEGEVELIIENASPDDNGDPGLHHVARVPLR